MIGINNRTYRVAKYLRLSRDDGDDRESESIENQRDIIDNYIENHTGLNSAKEYIDDGYTGTNFNRPGFKQMLQDIEDGMIDCIITKDLSRFGRDHIDTGYYLERYLPIKAIRYIAIGDNVDTNNPDGLQFLTFKLSFNDYYAQDISNKIRSVKQRKIEKGEFQGGIAPYGYQKDSEIKNHLIPDPESSKIVQEIFDMYVNKGMSTVKIADELNKKNIIPPSIYLKIPTFIQNVEKRPEEYKWEHSQISKMLKNEIYIGNVVGRKYQKISHKVDKVRRTRKEENIIVENKHKAIIDFYLWNKAQEKLNKHSQIRQRKHEHPLKNFVYCAECGGKAIYKIKKEKRKSGKTWKYEFFVCSRKNSRKNQCTCKQIKKEEIEEKIKIALKRELDKIKYTDTELNNIFEKAKLKSNSRKTILATQLEELKTKLKENENTMSEVYSDKLNKIISVEDFYKFYKKLEKDKEYLTKEIHQIEGKLQALKKENIDIDYNEIKKIANEVITSDNPSQEQYFKLIEKIEFDSQKNITILFTFEVIDYNEEFKEAI